MSRLSTHELQFSSRARRFFPDAPTITLHRLVSVLVHRASIFFQVAAKGSLGEVEGQGACSAKTPKMTPSWHNKNEKKAPKFLSVAVEWRDPGQWQTGDAYSSGRADFLGKPSCTSGVCHHLIIPQRCR
jgi:hypothetical protein